MNVQLIRTRGVFIKHETYEVSLVGITQQIVPVLEFKKKLIRIHQCFGVRVNGQLCGIQLTWVSFLSSHGCHCIQIISLACQVLKKNPMESTDHLVSNCVRLWYYIIFCLVSIIL